MRVEMLNSAWIDPKGCVHEIEEPHMNWIAKRYGLRVPPTIIPRLMFKMDRVYTKAIGRGWVRLGKVHLYRDVVFIEAHDAERLLEVLNIIPAIYKTVDEVVISMSRKHRNAKDLAQDMNAFNREVMTIATEGLLPNPQVMLRVRGRVQGVGFRNATQTLGKQMGLRGEVRNLKDGRVEAIAQGTRDELNQFVERVREGTSDFSDVTSVDEPLYSPEDQVFEDFSYEPDRDYGADDA
jgi:acylphosphatase